MKLSQKILDTLEKRGYKELEKINNTLIFSKETYTKKRTFEFEIQNSTVKIHIDEFSKLRYKVLYTIKFNLKNVNQTELRNIQDEIINIL